MKKLMTFALCVAAVGTMSAQKENVEAAKKLSGKFDKIEEARSLINAAIADPSTANDANTYYVAGKIEFDAYDKGALAGQINPNDASANPEKMAEELLNGYKMFLKVLPLDSIPNEKGQVKPKYSKDVVSKISGHAGDYFRAGGAMWDAKRYYPEAYEAFMIYADMPDLAFLGKNAPKLTPADRAQSYFNAGIAAYYGNEVMKAADAFKKSRLNGSEEPNTFIYELASWQAISQRDSTMTDEAYKNIQDIAYAGYEKFGFSQPIFVNNLVNNYVLENKYDEAIALVNKLLAENPDNPGLYGMLGFIYDRQGNDDLSLSNYLKAVSLENCDLETLKNTAKKLYRVGSNKYGELQPGDTAGKHAIRSNYYDKALEIAERAKAQDPDDTDIDRVIDSVKWALESYYGVTK